MQFFVATHELCMLHCVLLDCNGTKCTGNTFSIQAAACSQQLLRRNKLPTGCYFFACLVFSGHDMNVFVADLTAMLWLTCRDFQVHFMVNHHILVITVHVNCPHVRGPLYNILVITLHMSSHVKYPLHHIVITLHINYCTHEGSLHHIVSNHPAH